MPPFISSANASQLQAVQITESPLLIIAGLGSGGAFALLPT